MELHAAIEYCVSPDFFIKSVILLLFIYVVLSLVRNCEARRTGFDYLNCVEIHCSYETVTRTLSFIKNSVVSWPSEFEITYVSNRYITY